MVRQVVKTYAPGFGIEVVEVPHDGGTTDPDASRQAAGDAAAVLFQQPNFLGCLEPAPALAAAAESAGALAVAHVDLTTLGGARGPRRVRLRASRSARDRAPATTCRTAARTTASSRREAS